MTKYFSKTSSFRKNISLLKIKAGLFLIQILLLLSCNTESAHREKVYNSQINYIKINPQKTAQWNLSQVADSAFIIKLEKNEESIIGVIRNILIHNDKIYVLDATHARDVFVFNMSGNFLFKLDKIGKGPHEYYNPDAININEYTNQLEVYDAQNLTILKYTLDGAFISKVNSVPSIREFVSLDSAISACFTGNRLNYIYNPERNGYDSLLTDMFILNQNQPATKRIIPFFPFDYALHPMGLSYTYLSHFSKYKNKVYFQQTFNDTIYSVNKKGTVDIAYVVDYPDSIRTNIDLYNTNRSIIEKKFFSNPKGLYHISFFMESDDFQMLRFDYDKTPFTYMRLKNSGEEFIGELFNDLHGVFKVPPFLLQYKGNLISVISPFLIEEFLNYKLEKDNDYKFLKELKRLSSELEPDGNPVLLGYRIRK